MRLLRMCKTLSFIGACCLLLMANAKANESLLPDHSIIFYWAMPIDAEGTDAPSPSYGLRLDLFPATPPGDMRANPSRMQPASVDFEIGKRGIKSLKFSGHNVLHSSSADLDF